MGYTDGILLGSDAIMKLIVSGGKLIVTILGDVDLLTLGMNFGTELVSLDVFVDSCNDRKPEGIKLGSSLRSLMVKCLDVMKA